MGEIIWELPFDDHDDDQEDNDDDFACLWSTVQKPGDIFLLIFTFNQVMVARELGQTVDFASSQFTQVI